MSKSSCFGTTIAVHYAITYQICRSLRARLEPRTVPCIVISSPCYLVMGDYTPSVEGGRAAGTCWTFHERLIISWPIWVHYFARCQARLHSHVATGQLHLLSCLAYRALSPGTRGFLRLRPAALICRQHPVYQGLIHSSVPHSHG